VRGVEHAGPRGGLAERAHLDVVGVQAALARRVHAVLLVRADHDLGTAVACQVAYRGRVDDRALHQRVAGLVVEGHLVGRRVDGRHLRAVHHDRREAGHGRAAGPPGVQVAVHGRGHDLEPGVALDVGQHRRADEPALGPVALALAGLVEGLQRAARPVEARRPHPAPAAVGVPRVHPALEVGGDDLG
jgi:hypothetical protein